ncbi:MAG TPA: GMC family oxidoreductase [Pyrinomonadaceae bacterium]|nr:GMC family oxidoreductase [Pyrinomonadaceae bacterium]
MARRLFDVCVVGSGPGGGIAAYVLARAGLKVALIEAGPALRAGIDFGTHAWPYEVNENIRRSGRDDTPRLRFETEHFTPIGDAPRHGLLKAVGGRSLCWAGHSLRFGPLDFKQWPIDYEEVAPYYSRAERLMGVYGDKDGLWNLPDGEFLRPVPMRCPEAALKRGVGRVKARGRRMEFIALRKAILTEPHQSKRATCHYCGQCMLGCDVEAKYTSANTPIPLAMKTGNLTLLTGAMMTRILLSRDGRPRITSIEYTLANGKEDRVEAKAFVLACSAIETARHLLLNGIANSSGQVGRHLTSHFGLYVYGFFPDLARRDFSNDDGTDWFHSLLTGLYWDEPHPDFAGTYQVQCAAGLRAGRAPLAVRDVAGFGSTLKRGLRQQAAGYVAMNMQGTTLISPKKFVDLDPARRDRYGLNKPRIHLHYEPSDVAMAQDCVERCEEVIRAGGGEVMSAPGKVKVEDLTIDSNHWVGTCRMGDDPKNSVVDTSCQSHDIPNLFIGDASVFAANPEKNPTLTNIALSWRMSERLVEKFRRGEF